MSSQAGPSRLIPHPSLPAKPGTIPARSPTFISTPTRPSAPSILTPHAAALAPSSPADPTSPLSCSLCPSASKYTCPRCGARTCSLACSRAHKARMACDGVRDPARYVPLAQFGQGTWDGDYAWLEEGRRKVAGWGEGIDPRELGEQPTRGRGAPRGRGRGRGGRDTAGGKRSTRPKLDAIRFQLRRHGIDVEFLPDGMARRKENMSRWNPKTRKLYLTVHLLVPELITPQPLPLSTPLPTLLPSGTPDSVLLLPYRGPRARTPGVEPFFLLDPSGDRTLAQALRGTAFVEFPVIRVVERGEWERRLKEGSVEVVPAAEVSVAADEEGAAGTKDGAEAKEGGAEDGREAKRPKVVSLGALGDYASDDDEDDGDDDDAVLDAEHDMDAAADNVNVALDVAVGGEYDNRHERELLDVVDDEDEDAEDDGDVAAGADDVLVPTHMAAALAEALIADFGPA
ncbi:Box C/D snoRNA accumulation [Cryptotrichosporon argae]